MQSDSEFAPDLAAFRFLDQLCGLRFASDAELPKLAERAMNEKRSRADIKKSVQTWRPQQ